MAVVIRELAPPPDIKDKEAKAADRLEKFIQERNIRLSDDKIAKIEKHLKKVIKDAKREYDPLRKRLVQWDDMLEGIVDETNFPFEGASNVTLRQAGGLARTFEAEFNRTLYMDQELFYPVFEPGAEEELELDEPKLTALQEGFNHSFHTGSNGLQQLKGGTIPAFRDGTFLLEGSWERRVEMVNDMRTYTKIEEFQKDYPDAKSAGTTQEEYVNLLDEFLVNDDIEVISRFSYKHVQQDGVQYRRVARAKFLVYPTSVKYLRDSTLYGTLFELTKDELKRKGKKEFYEKGVEKALARRGGVSLDGWDRNRLLIEGRSSPLTEALPYRLADIVFKFDLDEDDTLEQYCGKVILEGEDCILVAMRPYDLRHNTPSIIPFRLVDRDHAFDGISMVGDGQDLFNQVDTLFRHDNNVMMLTTSPMFLADSNLKDTIDLGRAENVLRPGVTFWVPNPDKMPIRQLPVQDIAAASGDNNQKIAILTRFTEMLLGVSQGESGNQTPDDPRAPAHKTQLLLMQVGKMTDQKIDRWCMSFPDLAALHATLLFQFSAKPVYKFPNPKPAQQPGQPGMMQPQQQPHQKSLSFDLKILADPRLKWEPRRRSVTLTPEFAISRLQNLLQTYTSMRPLLMQGDEKAIEIWNRIVRQSGEPQSEKFMIDQRQAPQMMQRAIEMAMKQHQMQSTMKAHAKGQETLAKEAAKAVIDHLSEVAKMKASGAEAEEAAAHPQPQQQPQPQPAINGGQP